MNDLHFDEIRGRKTLILGDVGSGKTALTALLVTEAVATNQSTDITVIDMAPERKKFKNVMIGGRVTDFLDDRTKVSVLFPIPELRAPRTEGQTTAEVADFARSNAKSIGKLLHKYSANPTPILFINDVSMYLQAGEANELLKSVKATETFIANAYQGTTLQNDHDSGISEHERLELNALRNAVDDVIILDAESALTIQNTIEK